MFGLVPIKVTWIIIASCVLLVLILILSLGACVGSTSTPTTPKPSEPIKATWLEPNVVGDDVSIPVSEIESKKIIHFRIGTSAGDIAFMAYELDRKIYVRSNLCPPCRSVGFSLQKDTLVCDTCATTFKAKTGDGIKGACVAFPKASVPYEIGGDTIIMKRSDLIAAYQNTLKPGWP